jgi:CRISPR-associated protein Csb3
VTRSSIPVDVLNPGQVFAALGFLEAADRLCSQACGGFDWTDEARVRFVLEADGGRNPFEVVLGFLAKAELRRIAPTDYEDPPPKKSKKKAAGDDEEDDARNGPIVHSASFPNRKPDRMALPVQLTYDGMLLEITHWADGSTRERFKLYTGNRSAAMIATNMLSGTGKTKGVRALWVEDPKRLAERPFDVLTPLGGKFNFDARCAWTPLDAGYSPDRQSHTVAGSPVVELLAAIGLEHARPQLVNRESGVVRYAVWCDLVPPSLARPLLAGVRFGLPFREFQFTLHSAGENKIVTVAEKVISE